MTENPTIKVETRAPATRRVGVEAVGAARLRRGDLFEAPLYTVPYPLEACRGAVLDVRDADAAEAGPLGVDAIEARLARLGRL
jgi:hypothetical protein